MAGVVSSAERWKLTQQNSVSNRERKAIDDYYRELTEWEAKASRYDTGKSGGVRSRAIVEFGPPPTVPRSTPEWAADMARNVAISYGVGSVMSGWWDALSGAGEFGSESVIQAVETGSEVSEASSLIDLDWNAVANAWEGGAAEVATQNAAIEAGTSWLNIPTWAETAGDWAVDLGKKAVEQFVKQEIQEEFSAPASMRAPTIGYRSTPQQNTSPLSGLAGFLYPSIGQRTGGYTSGSGSSIPFFGGSPISGGGGKSNAPSMLSNPAFLIVAAVIAVIGFVTLLKR